MVVLGGLNSSWLRQGIMEDFKLWISGVGVRDSTGF